MNQSEKIQRVKRPKFRLFYPLELFGLIHKRPGQDPFFAKNQFSPTDEFLFMGLVIRSCHFDVTACAEARRLDNDDPDDDGDDGTRKTLIKSSPKM